MIPVAPRTNAFHGLLVNHGISTAPGLSYCCLLLRVRHASRFVESRTEDDSCRATHECVPRSSSKSRDQYRSRLELLLPAPAGPPRVALCRKQDRGLFLSRHARMRSTVF